MALTTIGTGIARSAGTPLQVTDLAPTAPDDPGGTVEFYCLVFLAIGAAVGATVLGSILGPVRNLPHLARRLGALVVCSGLAALTVTFFADVVFNALIGHFACCS